MCYCACDVPKLVVKFLGFGPSGLGGGGDLSLKQGSGWVRDLFSGFGCGYVDPAVGPAPPRCQPLTSSRAVMLGPRPWMPPPSIRFFAWLRHSIGRWWCSNGGGQFTLKDEFVDREGKAWSNSFWSECSISLTSTMRQITEYKVYYKFRGLAQKHRRVRGQYIASVCNAQLAYMIFLAPDASTSPHSSLITKPQTLVLALIVSQRDAQWRVQRTGGVSHDMMQCRMQGTMQRCCIEFFFTLGEDSFLQLCVCRFGSVISLSLLQWSGVAQ